MDEQSPGRGRRWLAGAEAAAAILGGTAREANPDGATDAGRAQAVASARTRPAGPNADPNGPA